MIARQRCEWQIGKRVRINPNDLVDLPGRLDWTFNIHGIDSRVDLKPRLVGRRTIKHAQGLRARVPDPATQFLGDFARQSGDVTFADIALATS